MEQVKLHSLPHFVNDTSSCSALDSNVASKQGMASWDVRECFPKANIIRVECQVTNCLISGLRDYAPLCEELSSPQPGDLLTCTGKDGGPEDSVSEVSLPPDVLLGLVQEQREIVVPASASQYCRYC